MKQGCGREWSAVEVWRKEAREPLVSDLVIIDKSIRLKEKANYHLTIVKLFFGDVY